MSIAEEQDAEPDADEMPAALDDQVAAEWAVRRLARLRAQIASNSAAAAAMVERDQAWEAEVNAPLIARAAAEEHSLAGWLTNRIAADPKSPRTMTLPSGELKYTGGSLVLEIEEGAFRKWATVERPDLLRHATPPDWTPPPPSPDKNAIKALIGGPKDKDRPLRALGDTDIPGAYELVETATGEAIPGVLMLRHEPKITVNTETPKGQRS